MITHSLNPCRESTFAANLPKQSTNRVFIFVCIVFAFLLMPSSRYQQFYLMWEDQLTLLAEPTRNRAPGSKPRQFILM